MISITITESQAKRFNKIMDRHKNLETYDNVLSFLLVGYEIFKKKSWELTPDKLKEDKHEQHGEGKTVKDN